MTPERVQAAVRMRAEGDSIAQIARTFGVGASSASRALAKQGDETPVTTSGVSCLRVLTDECG